MNPSNASSNSRKGTLHNQTAISLRAKNNSVNGNTPGMANYLLQATPSTIQGYNSNFNDQDNRGGHRRTGSKMDKPTPQKTNSQTREHQMSLKQQFMSGGQSKLHDRGRVGQS